MADLDTEERRKLAEQGKALPDGSFPIRNREDLKDAIQSFGRAKGQGRSQALDQAPCPRAERREGAPRGLVGGAVFSAGSLRVERGRRARLPG
jgi:hypothetical protein